MRNVSAVERLSSYHLRVTKRITDIFRSTCKRILIEGAPGIGKTVLAKEIAYCWANGEILTDTKLFLLVIRDPNLHCVESIKDLVHYLNNDYLSDTEANVAVDELRISKGSGIVLVIDGYDECPSDSKLKDFINELVEGKRLPMCMVVITSRPTASLLLHQMVNQRIEILGLAKKERDQYISESLKQSPEKIIKLQEYLKRQPIINSLIYVPLHLAILLYLFKQDSLPETLTELNEYFIIHTIYRHLTKQRQLVYMKIDKITDLPEPELTIVYQLSELAYNGLCDSKLVFTYDEMKRVCPEVDDIPGAISGFGLLQSVECYHHKAAGKSISLNFLHFTMQEYLAAFHVSILPSEQQKSLMENTFWHRKFNFMWIMFVGIVGPQSATLINSLYQPYLIHYQGQCVFVKKYLFLFQCYLELKEIDIIPVVIMSIFNDGNIDLSGQALLPHHIMSLTVFMMRSTTQWKSLNLNSCFIGCNGISILKNLFINFQEKIMTIKRIGLRHNNLTSLWTTLTDIVRDDTDETMLSSGLLNSVESFDLSCNQLSDSGIVELFSVLMCYQKPAGPVKLTEDITINTTLQNLDISHNIISDHGAAVISQYLMMNGTLCILSISRNKITDRGAKRLAEAIQVNTTLEELNISKNLVSKEGVMRIVEACTINRTLHKLVCTHNNLSKSGLTVINEYIRKENAVQIFEASWNTICNKDGRLAIKTKMQLLGVRQVQTDEYTVQEDSWFIDEIDDLEHRKEYLNCCLDVEHLDLAHIKMTDFQLVTFSECLMTNTLLKELDLSSNKICDEGVKYSAEVIKVIPTLPKARKSYQRISDGGISPISGCLKINSTLCKLNLSGNRITDREAQKLAEAIKINKTLQELNISKNWISKEGVMRIVEACTINRTLHKLVCTHNNLSKSGLAVINEYIRKENAIQIFDASWNSLGSKYGWLAFKTTFELLDVQQKLQSNNGNIKEELWYVDEITDPKYVRKFLQCSLDDVQYVNVTGAIMTNDQMSLFCDCLMNNSTLTELNLSSNEITDEGAETLIEAIQVNTTLQSLDISHNTIFGDGLSSISKINSALCKLNLSSNKITDEGAMRLAEAIKVNKTLQKLNISKNWISKEGVMRIVEACTINRTLHKLVCTHNNLSKSGLAVINEYIKKENAVQIFEASYNTVIASSSCGPQLHLVIPILFQSLIWSPDGWENNFLNYDKQVWLVDDTIWENIPCRFTHDSLTELEFPHNSMIHNALVDIVQGIAQVDTLQKLDISGNKISDDGAIAFGACLNANTTLTEIDMSWNNITCKGASVIAESIQVNTALQKLNISDNKICDDGAIAFGVCLNTNTALIELYMARTDITCKGASLIAEAIQVNTALQKLDISHNKISDDGAIAFCECLKTNTTLIELDMWGNNITCKGACVIAKAIQVNTALQKLNISYNEISDDGAIAFSECLKTNTTLIELDMSWNYISDRVMQSVVLSLGFSVQRNRTH